MSIIVVADWCQIRQLTLTFLRQELLDFQIFMVVVRALQQYMILLRRLTQLGPRQQYTQHFILQRSWMVSNQFLKKHLDQLLEARRLHIIQQPASKPLEARNKYSMKRRIL
jgi:hypothetical protein